MPKPLGIQVGDDVPLRLTFAQYRALLATDRGEVFRTRSSIANTLTGPCGSIPLWALARAGLIADPAGGGEHGRHRMVVTPKGHDALTLASLNFKRRKKHWDSVRRTDPAPADTPDSPDFCILNQCLQRPAE